jgi:enoyl-CoA hydratase/carnithine racemase
MANVLLAEFGCIRIVKLASPGVIGVEMNTQAKGRNKMNLMDHAFFENVQIAFDHISTNMGDDARVALLYSTPVGISHFSAGLNLKSVSEEFFGDASLIDKAKLAGKVVTKSTEPPSMKGPMFPAMKQMKIRQFIRTWQEGVSSVARCRVPVIGVLNKCAFGGAIDLACACDFRVASQSVQLAVQEAKVGIVADIGTLQRLPNIVGHGIAREWAYTARQFGADEALRTNLVNHVLPDDEKAVSHALSIAIEIASACSPLAVQGTKEILNHQTEPEVQQGLDYVRQFNSAFLLNEDVVAASLKFITKSKEDPKWKCRVLPDSSYSPTAAVKHEEFRSIPKDTGAGTSAEGTAEVTPSAEEKTKEKK